MGGAIVTGQIRNFFIDRLRDPRVKLAVLRYETPTVESAYQNHSQKISGGFGLVPFLMSIMSQ